MLDLKQMSVWNNKNNSSATCLRWVIRQFNGGGCIAVVNFNTYDYTKKEVIYKIRHNVFLVNYWEHCAILDEHKGME